MASVDTNEFSFSGRIAKTPTEKKAGDLLIVETAVEQENMKKDKVTVVTTTVPITAFGDIGKALLERRVGDHVVVWGNLKSNAYNKNGELKHFLNPTINRIFVIKDSEVEISF